MIRWLKHSTTWSQLNILAQQLTDVTEVVFVRSEVRIHFTTDLRTIFRSLVSRTTIRCWETKCNTGPILAQDIGNSTPLCPAQCICSKSWKNIWNLVITHFSWPWPFLVRNVTKLLFGMSLGSFKWQQIALSPYWRHSDNVSPNNRWVTVKVESGTF